METNVMKLAWSIAKKGQKRFGGKVSEYFAQALKMAHKELKNRKAAISVLDEYLEGAEQNGATVKRFNNDYADVKLGDLHITIKMTIEYNGSVNETWVYFTTVRTDGTNKSKSLVRVIK